VSNNDKKERAKVDPNVIAFPHSRVKPRGSTKLYKNLGAGKMGDKYGTPKEQLTGHWCSRCEGIWFGYLLEAECPKWGNRQG